MMRPHHAESIKNMTDYYRQNPKISALFLVGSVATNTERPDSDIDGVAIIPREYYDHKKATTGTMEVIHGKCTYEHGYFDIHFFTREHLQDFLKNGGEPMRNLFSSAQTLFCDEPDLPEIVRCISVFPEVELEAKLLRHYCTFKQYYLYYWLCCKPEGYHRSYIANGMIFNLYRLILLENKILFPSTRKLEETVKNTSNKPIDIIKKCHDFMQNLSDKEAELLIEAYENWTNYNYPKESHIIINNFQDPYEWQ